MSITHLYLPTSRIGSKRKEEEEKQNRNAALGVNHLKREELLNFGNRGTRHYVIIWKRS